MVVSADAPVGEGFFGADLPFFFFMTIFNNVMCGLESKREM